MIVLKTSVKKIKEGLKTTLQGLWFTVGVLNYFLTNELFSKKKIIMAMPEKDLRSIQL